MQAASNWPYYVQQWASYGWNFDDDVDDETNKQASFQSRSYQFLYYTHINCASSLVSTLKHTFNHV